MDSTVTVGGVSTDAINYYNGLSIDSAMLNATLQKINVGLQKWQATYLTDMAKGFKVIADQTKVLATKTFSDENVWGHRAQPRAVTRDQMLDSLEKIVAAVGSDYIATSHATNTWGEDGRRCVQGELMLDLGWKKGEELPGYHSDVAALMLLEHDEVAYAVLERAETMNDVGRPWGEILQMTKTMFAKAA